MDGNKDEALKCLRIGKKALESGERARALKFLSKARRLDPALPIDDLLSAAGDGDGESHDSSPSQGQSNSSKPPFNEPDSSSSTTATTAKARVSQEASSRSYTEEQITIVRQLKKQKDYYQILGLERDCTVEDVRKAYRKLSLRVHPDKNTAPGADEAFKAVSKAFQCLSNDESRKRYDLVGSEEPNYDRPAAARGRTQGFNGFYDGDIDAEEIFRNFFFGGMAPATATPFGTYRFRTGGMGGQGFNNVHTSGNFNLRGLIQILPIIIFVLANILPSFLPSSQPPYVLSSSYGYNYKVETQRGVPYYVKSEKFEQEYPYGSQERDTLEQRVEREYVGILRQNCHVELQRRQWGLAYQTPHCDMLQKYQEAA